MKGSLLKIIRLLKTKTSVDTLTLFTGDTLSAAINFLITLIIARALTISEFGTYAVILNLITIITSLSVFGMNAGIVNFIAGASNKNKEKLVNKFTKVAFVSRFTLLSIILSLVLISSPVFSKIFIDSDKAILSVWVVVLSLLQFFSLFPSQILIAKKEFIKSVALKNSVYLLRLVVLVLFLISSDLGFNKVLWTFFIANFVALSIGYTFIGISFFNSKPELKVYKDFLKFSSWVGLGKFLSSLSTKLDIQVLVLMAGSTAVGIYSIPSKLVSYLLVLSSSMNAVFATRLARYKSKQDSINYLKKIFITVAFVIFFIIIWTIMAKPFILLLFGNKYSDSIPVFQALAIATIPGILNSILVSVIIYSVKNTSFISKLSLIQLILSLMLNFIFIPKYGVFGPVISLAIVNILLLVVSTTRLYRYYYG